MSSEQSEANAVYRRYLSALMLHGQTAARAVDLGATDGYALTILQLAGPMTPGELGARTGLTTGPTTRLIDRLEQAGYVRRIPVPGDRRKLTVELVDPPADLDRVLGPARRRIGEILGGYRPEERELLLDYFRKAADAYVEAAEELRA
ncbi:MarR family winged helix-turn-helix transcriptional regulator [Nocardia amikacinitolerans]|uniref:MarR family winged helix-turn-helix transcriptional regulator n=1 Tax=Nocardia amikacinitolerans TaxID=756689 RepID=UPI0020A321AC|nr:MarR family transcriptional regulator [Nocardia amikacinitolerans]MCP2292966.1 DNA-binding transcriptional regulator, MarR family [Nocardia amikacinitolerans]